MVAIVYTGEVNKKTKIFDKVKDIMHVSHDGLLGRDILISAPV
jgi:hypothetical protein